MTKETVLQAISEGKATLCGTVRSQVVQLDYWQLDDQKFMVTGELFWRPLVNGPAQVQHTYHTASVRRVELMTEL